MGMRIRDSWNPGRARKERQKIRVLHGLVMRKVDASLWELGESGEPFLDPGVFGSFAVVWAAEVRAFACGVRGACVRAFVIYFTPQPVR